MLAGTDVIGSECKCRSHLDMTAIDSADHRAQNEWKQFLHFSLPVFVNLTDCRPSLRGNLNLQTASPLDPASQLQQQEEYLQAAKAAEVLAAELQATEDRINRQQEEFAAMQVRL